MRKKMRTVAIMIMMILSMLACKTTQKSVVAATKPGGPQLDGMIRGHVSYRERIALPGDFWLEVHLVQLKEDGSPGHVLARAMTEEPTRVIPVPFTMRYSPKSVDPANHKYGLIANIYVGKKLWFSNVQPYPVFKGRDHNVDIIAQRVM